MLTLQIRDIENNNKTNKQTNKQTKLQEIPQTEHFSAV